MSVDVTELIRFYATPLGVTAARLLGHVIGETWTDMRGLRVLGLGYAGPYLDQFPSDCERVLAFMPPGQGVCHWPGPDVSAAAMADPGILPLPEASIDRILVVHAMETSPDPAELMDEVSRVLTPTGRALFLCPNRRGLWARLDTTPFGQGQPFSRRQIRRLLHNTQLEAATWREALYIPPFRNALVLRSATGWERLAHGLSLPFAGLHLVEVTKRLHRPIAVRTRQRRRALEPTLVPVPASRSRT